MSQRTLNEMIRNVIGGPDDEGDLGVTPAYAPTPTAYATTDEVEKLASALEWVGTHGVSEVVKLAGRVENDQNRAPMKGRLDTSDYERGTSHPALSSNEAAIKASPTLKEQRTAPALKHVLNRAGGSNNHQKMKKTASEQLEIIRAEKARRAARGM